MKSTFLTLKTRDFLKGLAMAGLVPVFVIIQQSISAGDLTFNWKAIGMAAVAGFIGYLTKNFFTDDTKQALKVLEEEKIISSSNAKKLETFKTAAPKDSELNK